MDSHPKWNPAVRVSLGLLLLLIGGVASQESDGLSSFATASLGVGLYLLAATIIGVVERLPRDVDIDQTDSA